ncbi:MAG: hypothetical protein AAB541_03360 [Patescibacteria group bacterium]
MSAERNLTYTFGNNPPFEADRSSIRDGQVTSDKLAVRRPEIDKDRFLQALEDINRTWGIITDPKTGKEFEIALANLSAPLDNGLDVELSTFTSSISGNPGNAVEFAENSALHPDRQRLYIATFGNGRSSYWDAEEQKHIRETGRFMQDNGEALPTVASLERALKRADLPARRFSTNSGGGAPATALMGTLPEGQVTHAYIKSRPNISDHPLNLAWGVGIAVGDLLDDRKYKKASEDPWRLTGDLIATAKEYLPEVYSPEAQNRHQSLAQKAGSSHRAGKMLTDMTAFSRGGMARNYPASQDTVRALQQQPESLLTYHFPLQDRLYRSPEDIAQFLVQIYKLSSVVVKNGQVEILTMPGRHRDHTQYPGMRWGMESYALSRK